MSNKVIELQTVREEKNFINIKELKSNRNRQVLGLIEPSLDKEESITIADNAAEPIKSLDDIDRITNYLLSNSEYRDYMLFIVGINFGLRASDLLQLRFTDLINDNYTFKDRVVVFEIKTRNTRKNRKNRYITINNAVIDAVTLYLENTDNIRLDHYMFRSMSNRVKSDNSPLTVRSLDRILKNIQTECKLNMKVSTHTLRKTFAYHQMMMSNNDPRKLLLLQKMLGHSTSVQTLDYIGLTDEEMATAYAELNLGQDNHYRHIIERSFGNDQVSAWFG